ncbi:MO25 protein [Cryptosporidium canis]|nr:MO25 protein [Cryptosporidium canis]
MLNWINLNKRPSANIGGAEGGGGSQADWDESKGGGYGGRLISRISRGIIGGVGGQRGPNGLEEESCRRVREEFIQTCDGISDSIVRLWNDRVGEGERLEAIENRDDRNRVVERMMDNKRDLSHIVGSERREVDLREGLEKIKLVFLDLVERQEKELNLWLKNGGEQKMEWNEGVESIYQQIFALSEIYCNSLLLNITCVLGYISTEEHSLWVSIISLLIVFEIRGCQHTALLKESQLLDEPDQDHFVILDWLNTNCDEFFSLLIRQYSVIPITYKIGEVLRDISTILNLAQGPGIVDKQNNKTFPISESFKEKSNEIIRNLIYKQEIFNNLMWLSGNQCFDISSDSISTLRCYLFVSPKMTNEYILSNQQTFFSNIFKTLIQSKEYVPQRHGLRLLNQLFSLKELSKVMTVFSSSSEYLKIFMNLITSELNTTSFEAFHIFKLFVANPNKSPKIQRILSRNRDKIVEFLVHFQTSRTDPQFISDKQVSSSHPKQPLLLTLTSFSVSVCN